MFDSESDHTPTMVIKSAHAARTAQSQSRPLSTQQDEVQQLRSQLADRDKQLEKQAADIEEMQHSVNELQSNVPTPVTSVGVRSSRGSGLEELDAPSLRTLVREKNEKIRQLTEEFDSHRADFRDTIDILEHTSDETNRLHQEKIDSLQEENRDLHERMERGEDINALTQTLKQLDEQVQELEEGLEDARRGEAEARGEAEFLRGEVERGKAELDREKQKNALKGVQGSNDGGVSSSDLLRELKRKDDEIKGLRAIIHSLNQSESADKGSPRSSRRISKQRDSGQAEIGSHVNEQQLTDMRQAQEKLQKEVQDLQDLVDRKTYREEELENEIQRLHNTTAHVSTYSNGYSEHTTRPNSKHRPTETSNPSIDWNERGSPTAKFGASDTFAAAVTQNSRSIRNSRDKIQATPESDGHSTTMTDASNLWCDLCDTAGHDILHCTNMSSATDTTKQSRHGISNSQDQGLSSPWKQNRDVVHSHDMDSTKLEQQGQTAAPQYHPVNTLHSPTPPPANAPMHIASAPTSQSKSSSLDPPNQQATPKLSSLTDSGLVAGKDSGVIDENKWCAICERDGHDVTDCPFEGQF